MSNYQGFGTKAIHGKIDLGIPQRPINVPIFQNATYSFENTAQGAARFAGEEEGYIYTRLGNPTTTVVEDRIASLENAEAGAAFASGMGAISTVIWSRCKAGDHIIADTTLYGCTYALLQHGIPRYGIEVTFVDLLDTQAFAAAFRSNTTMVYFETPTNPNIRVIDIAEVVKISREKRGTDVQIVVDNTFATPYLQRPLELGVDIVVHSATKYLNGHGDVIAGFAVGSHEEIANIKSVGIKDLTGAVQSPNDSFLILRGLKTLELRMERHCDNAEKLVEYLNNHEKIEKVYFPGLTTHPTHSIAKKQMSRYGGMLAFEVKGGFEAGSNLLNNMELAVLAVSLGDAETLVEHPASMTHATYSPEERAAVGIPEGLVRVSPGLENIADILADFEQALNKI